MSSHRLPRSQRASSFVAGQFQFSIPFYDRDERELFQKETNIDGFLLGRPALYNTSTFLPKKSPLVDKTNVIQEYIRQAMRYETHYKNAKYVICEMMNNRRAPSDRVPFLPQAYAGVSMPPTLCDGLLRHFGFQCVSHIMSFVVFAFISVGPNHCQNL